MGPSLLFLTIHVLKESEGEQNSYLLTAGFPVTHETSFHKIYTIPSNTTVMET